MFTYQASGKLCFRSYTSVYSVRKVITTKFQERDVAYSLKKANKGILYEVVIKKLLLTKTLYTGANFIVIYVDTYNGYWNEWDLVTHAEAINLATIYYLNLLDDVNDAMDMISPPCH